MLSEYGLTLAPWSVDGSAACGYVMLRHRDTCYTYRKAKRISFTLAMGRAEAGVSHQLHEELSMSDDTMEAYQACPPLICQAV